MTELQLQCLNFSQQEGTGIEHWVFKKKQLLLEGSSFRISCSFLIHSKVICLYTCISILFQILFPLRLSQRIESSFCPIREVLVGISFIYSSVYVGFPGGARGKEHS